MKKNYSLFLFFVIIIISSCKETKTPRICKEGISPIKKVLFIGLDGCRTDAFLQANTPALDALTEEAYVSLYCDRGPHTVSVPGWSSLLHGVWPEKHGLTENSFKNSNYKNYPDVFCYLDQHDSDFNLASITHWFDFLKITTNEDYANSFNSDEKAKNKAIDLIETCTPDVLLIHLDDIDHAGHGYGYSPDIPEYLESIEKNDRQVGEIMEVIYQREQELNEEWLVIVATDHGGVGTGHGGQDDIEETRFVFLIARTPNQNRIDLPTANNTDVMPTILDYLNIPIQTDWDLDGESLL